MSGKPAKASSVIEFNACCADIEKFFAELRRKYGNDVVNVAVSTCSSNRAM
jgi:hypothetical protein